MSSTAIRAGKAWIELVLKDKTATGLKAAQQRFVRWGVGLAKVGAVITGVAGGILTALGAAAKAFADAGSEIYDMSQATGVGAESLSALKYAAEQSGATLGDVAGGMKGLAKLAHGAASGSDAAERTLKALGLTAEQFLAASPEQRLALVAEGLKGIPDPGIRSAVAMEALGKSAQNLGPLLADGAAGLAALTARARELGITITDDEAKKADALGDAWGDVGAVWKATVIKVGAALAPLLMQVLEVVLQVSKAVGDFVRNNQGLVTGLAIAAAIVGVVGVALVALGATVMAVGLAIGVAMNPITWIVLGVGAAFAALAAAVYAFGGRMALVGALFGVIVQPIRALWDVIMQTVRGVFDAIAAGNWRLAGQILMLGLSVAMERGIYGLKHLWEGFKSWLVGLFADMFSGVLQMIGSFQRRVVDSLNALKSDLGLEPNVKGFAALDKLLKAGQSGAGRIKRDAESRRLDNLAPAAKRLAEAERKLAMAVQLAADQRARLATPTKTPSDPGYAGGGAPSSTSFADSSAGTFNAAIAGMLARSAESPEERTAEAAEESAEHLAAIRERAEEGFLVAAE